VHRPPHVYRCSPRHPPYCKSSSVELKVILRGPGRKPGASLHTGMRLSRSPLSEVHTMSRQAAVPGGAAFAVFQGTSNGGQRVSNLRP